MAASAPLAFRRHASGTAVADAAPAPGAGSVPPDMAAGMNEATMEQLKGLVAARDQMLVDASQWMVDWMPFLPGLTHFVQQLPQTLGLTSSYGSAIAIAGLTFFLRTFVSLPSIIWARQRALRLTQKFWPEWSQLRKDVPSAIIKDMKRTRTSSQKEFQLRVRKTLKDKSRELMKKYRCNPIWTVLGPLLVNVPLFLLMSTMIRYGCVPPTPWTGEYAPFPWAAPSGELIEKFEATTRIAMEKGASAEELESLKPKLGPSLVERDSTGFGSLILGMTYLLATEVGAYRRRLMDRDGELNAAKKGFPSEMVGSAATPRSNEPTTEPAGSPAQTESQAQAEANRGLTAKLRENLLSNLMRAMSIVFIVISSQVPSAVLVYWMSNAFYTLGQNIFLALADRKTLADDARSANAPAPAPVPAAAPTAAPAQRLARKAPPRSRPPVQAKMP